MTDAETFDQAGNECRCNLSHRTQSEMFVGSHDFLHFLEVFQQQPEFRCGGVLFVRAVNVELANLVVRTGMYR